MRPSRNTKVAALTVLLVALAVAGGAFAAARHGSGGAKASTVAVGTFAGLRAGGLSGQTGRGPDAHGPGDDLAAAAGYLGISESALATQLQSGKTLAQIADAASGKSAAGLVDALVTHEQAELAQAVKDGRLTHAQADDIAATLKDRFTNLVNGTRPPRPPWRGGSPPPTAGLRI
jgi:hypothetical protein